jgi:hypothetical protein
MSYLRVRIELFICNLLGPTSSCVVLPAWSLIFRGGDLGKIDVSSLASEHIINPDELRFPIELPADWQSPIKPLCSNQVERLPLRHNNCLIFLFGFLLHWCHMIGDVFNMRKSSYGFNLCLLYADISSVDNWAFFKKSFTSRSDWSWLPSFSTEW